MTASTALTAKAPPEDPSAKQQTLTILSLPPELHAQIFTHLLYPDRLSLKHTCRYFYNTVPTGVSIKVDWLIQRRMLHLECPNEKSYGKCLLGSDMEFCRGSVRLLMERRRRHGECEAEGGRGCLVFGVRRCVWKKEERGWWVVVVEGVRERWWAVLGVVVGLLAVVFGAGVFGALAGTGSVTRVTDRM